MKHTAVASLSLWVTIAAAVPGAIPINVPINCAKPNANYCMGGDIILRCDANAIGTRGQCSDSVSGYPPAGGTAVCWQSGPESGDAACEKNCVVYADQPFTLAADMCTPSVAVSGIAARVPEGTSLGTPTGIVSIPEGTNIGAPMPPTTDTEFMSIPEGTSLGTPIPAPTSNSEVIYPAPSSTGTWWPSRSGDCPTTTGTSATQSTTAGSNPSTSGSSTVPTAAANTNNGVGALAVAGLFAAFLV